MGRTINCINEQSTPSILRRFFFEAIHEQAAANTVRALAKIAKFRNRLYAKRRTQTCRFLLFSAATDLIPSRSQMNNQISTCCTKDRQNLGTDTKAMNNEMREREEEEVNFYFNSLLYPTATTASRHRLRTPTL